MKPSEFLREESHALSYESTNWLLNVIRGQKINVKMKEIDEEAVIAEIEIRAILDKILEIGDGDIAVGCLKGVEEGILDSCFSPNKQVRDLVMGIKDNSWRHPVERIRQSAHSRKRSRNSIAPKWRRGKSQKAGKWITRSSFRISGPSARANWLANHNARSRSG